MANRLSALTTRGRAFVAAGAAAALSALLLGQDDLLRVAVLLVALPIITCLVVARTRYRIAATRFVEPRRVPVGHRASVRLRLENMGRMPTGLLLLEDRVPYALGARPRFVLDRISARWTRDVAYDVRSEVRGRFTLGPLALRVTDPFGLVDLARAFKTTDTLLVTPVVVELPQGRLPGEWSATGQSRPRALAVNGEEDATVREYRDGDDLRRVHWRSSARRGELMVRREEQPWQSRATLFLDTRSSGHHGSGPASSFEWAVSATASIGVHLLRRNYALRFATDAGLQVDTATREASTPTVGEGLLLEALAGVQTMSRGRLRNVRSALPGDSSLGALIAVVGTMTAEDAEAMVRLRQSATAGYAILLDTVSWAGGVVMPSVGSAERLEQIRLLLQRGGWQVIRARSGDDIRSLWAQLAYDRSPGAVHGAAGATGTSLAPAAGGPR